MDRRTFVGGLALGLVATPHAVRAQPASKTFRIGYLSPTDPGDVGYLMLRKALVERGYVEGRNVVFEKGFALGSLDRLPGLAADLVGRRVDVIVAGGPAAIRAGMGATTTIPIVMAFAGDDPVMSGFVADLARPGGNVTGVTALSSDLPPKWMQLLLEVNPGIRRVGVLTHPARPQHPIIVSALQAVRPPSVELRVAEARGPDQYREAFDAFGKWQATGVVILADPFFTRDARQLAELCALHRLTAIYQWREFALAGGLMSYGPDHRDLAGLAARHVVDILNGANPGELAVHQPTRFELALNLATAKALGLSIPRSLRMRADEVVG